jgi:predicted transcriptional regulator
LIKEYLKSLKSNGNFSWQDISKASGLPEATIRKIFSGETADPRFETVVRLVSAMGGSLDKINDIEKSEKIEKSEESQMKALIAVKEIYEERIKELKDSSSEHLHSLKRDKKILTVAVCVLSVVLMSILLLDVFIGTIGWIRY